MKARLHRSSLTIWLAALGCAATLAFATGSAHAAERGGFTGPVIQRAVRGYRWQVEKNRAFSHMTVGQRIRVSRALRSPFPRVHAWGVRQVLQRDYVGPN